MWSWLWARLRHNIGLKLLSLLMALVIWGIVHNQADPIMTRQQKFPVQALNVPAGLTVAAIDPAEVVATLTGRRSALEALERPAAAARIVADLSKAAAGTVSAPLQPEGFPRGIEIKSLSHRLVEITLEAVVSRAKPIFVQTRGEPALGYALAGTQAQPTEATVRGASSQMRRITRLLAPVDLAGRAQSFSLSVPLVAVDALGLAVSGVTIEPPEATITVQLRQVTARALPVAPVISQLPEGFEIAAVSVQPPVVTLTGAPQQLAGLAAVQTAPLRLHAVSGRTQYEATLRVPRGLRVLGSASVRVFVTLEKAATAPATSSAPGQEPSAKGAPAEAPKPSPVPPSEPKASAPATPAASGSPSSGSSSSGTPPTPVSAEKQ